MHAHKAHAKAHAFLATAFHHVVLTQRKVAAAMFCVQWQLFTCQSSCRVLTVASVRQRASTLTNTLSAHFTSIK